MKNFDVLHQLENALINIDGAVAVLHRLALAPDERPGGKDLTYLASRLTEHHRAAEDAFSILWRLNGGTPLLAEDAP